MPPLQTPGIVYTTQKRYHEADRPRRGQDPALQTGANGQRAANPAWGAPLPGGIYASPTNTRYRVYDLGDG